MSGELDIVTQGVHRRRDLRDVISGRIPPAADAHERRLRLLPCPSRCSPAGPAERVVLPLDDAGRHTLPNLVVVDGLRLVYLQPYSPELHPPPAETLWTLVDEPIVNTFVPDLDKLIDTMTERCSDLTTLQTGISSRTDFAWWPADHIPS